MIFSLLLLLLLSVDSMIEMLSNGGPLVSFSTFFLYFRLRNFFFLYFRLHRIIFSFPPIFFPFTQNFFLVSADFFSVFLFMQNFFFSFPPIFFPFKFTQTFCVSVCVFVCVFFPFTTIQTVNSHISALAQVRKL